MTTEGSPAPASTPTDDTAPDSHINTNDGRQYWEGVNADVDGMLGGFAYISKADLQGSKNFLAKMGVGTKEGLRRVESALEGGAGIGRITKGLLLDIAEEVDVVEPIAKFTAALRDVPGVRTVFNVGLEEWQPSPSVAEGESDDFSSSSSSSSSSSPQQQHYDLIWIQWCLGHLTDEQVVQFLKRCRAVLTPETGFIVVKENLSASGVDLFDKLDSSVTRQDSKFLEIFEESGLRVVRAELQRGMPKGLYKIKSYALR